MVEKRERPMNKELPRLIRMYKDSIKSGSYIASLDTREMKKMEKKFGIKKIEPKQYRFLMGIREASRVGEEINYERIALMAGYRRGESKMAKEYILPHIPDELFEAVVGVGKRMVHQELGKLARQDKDLKVKVRALSEAAKIVGLVEEGKDVNIQINSSIPVAD